MAPGLPSSLAEALRRTSDRGGIEYAEQVEHWLSLQPDQERVQLVKDIESTDPVKNESAILELFLGGFLKAMNMPFVRHPTLGHTTRKPDYLVHHPEGDFYLEATLAGEQYAYDQKSQTHQLRICLDKVEGPCLIHMEIMGPVPGSFSRRKLQNFVRDNISGFRPGAVPIGREFFYADGPLSLSFKVISEQLGGCVLGSWSDRSKGPLITTVDAIRTAVEKKAGRYGGLAAPFVVAVKPTGAFPVGLHDIETAAFGDRRVTLNRTDSGSISSADWHNAQNGIFTATGNGGPLRTRVSALAVYKHTIGLDDRSRHGLFVLHNPYATRPLPMPVFSRTFQIAVASRDSGRIQMDWNTVPPRSLL